MPAAIQIPETKLIAPATTPPGLERWHIDDVKVSKKGKITRVHHVIWGWMKPSSLYFLEKLHDLFPGVNATGNSLAHGGYIFKSAVVQTAPSVFGFSLPVGVGLYAWASINLYNNVQDAKRNFALADLYDAMANRPDPPAPPTYVPPSNPLPQGGPGPGGLPAAPAVSPNQPPGTTGRRLGPPIG